MSVKRQRTLHPTLEFLTLDFEIRDYTAVFRTRAFMAWLDLPSQVAVISPMASQAQMT